MKCIECNGLGITIFVEVWHKIQPPAKIRFDTYTCKACQGNGKQSLLKNFLWWYKHREEVASGGACLVHYNYFPVIAFGGVLNYQKDMLTKTMQQELQEHLVKEKENVNRPSKSV